MRSICKHHLLRVVVVFFTIRTLSIGEVPVISFLTLIQLKCYPCHREQWKWKWRGDSISDRFDMAHAMHWNLGALCICGVTRQSDSRILIISFLYRMLRANISANTTEQYTRLLHAFRPTRFTAEDDEDAGRRGEETQRRQIRRYVEKA